MVKPTRFYSSQQEKTVAKNLNGKVNPNSGAVPFAAGDVYVDNILLECKTSVAPVKSFSIKKTVILKAKEEAFAMGKDFAVIAFNFGPSEENYYVLAEKHFKELIQK